VGVTSVSPQAGDLGVTPVTELRCHGRPNWGDSGDAIGMTPVSPKPKELTIRAEPKGQNTGHSPEKSSSKGGDSEPGRDPAAHAAEEIYRRLYREVLGTEPKLRPPEEKKLEGIAKDWGSTVVRLLELFFEADRTNYSVWAFEKWICDAEREVFFKELWEAYPRKEEEPQARMVWENLEVDEAVLDKMLKTLEWQR